MVNIANNSLYRCNDMRPSKLTVYIKLRNLHDIHTFDLAILTPRKSAVQILFYLLSTWEYTKEARTRRASKKL